MVEIVAKLISIVFHITFMDSYVLGILTIYDCYILT